ncbi:hypothetical protein B9Z19DRAFT_1119146 [Tuber borchii]|uniref:Uncharacterized protein n=1 Tax=Tuber borchii TaxID=42251 RepID=A0A2T7A6T9_TUBBO|nr:hypothetical protein B9Z19DRAFT_1119146 [Tuber borchii]
MAAILGAPKELAMGRKDLYQFPGDRHLGDRPPVLVLVVYTVTLGYLSSAEHTEAILGETKVHQRREKLNMGAFCFILDPYSATLERIKWHGSSDVDFSHRAAAAGQ